QPDRAPIAGQRDGDEEQSGHPAETPEQVDHRAHLTADREQGDVVRASVGAAGHARPVRCRTMDDNRLHVRHGREELPDEHLVAELRGLLAEARSFEQLADRMALLSDERRLRILFCLHAHPEVRSSDVARAIGALESTTSHALALLRDAGWVRARRSGREVRYELADAF